MDDIASVFLSWQFLLIGIIVYLVFGLANNYLGPALWKIQRRSWRKFMKFMEGAKLIWPPLLGFALGWLPGIPRPDPLTMSNQFTVALLYSVAGLCCQWIVKGVKKALEARGINIDLDLDPRGQKKAKTRL